MENIYEKEAVSENSLFFIRRNTTMR